LSCFYNLSDFEPIMEVDQLGAIMAHGDMFYMYMNKVISVYDRNGKLTDRRSIEIENAQEGCCRITIIKNKLLISLLHKIVIIKIN
jgi:hypothetical protein